MLPQTRKRNRRLIADHLAGLTQEALPRRYAIIRERVRQVLRDAGYAPRYAPDGSQRPTRRRRGQ
jgi:hypothetical protein